MPDTQLVMQEKQHVSWLVKWRNNDELRHLLNTRKKTNVAEQEAALKVDKSCNNNFIIEHGKPVGQCGVVNIHWRNRTGKLFIYIGERGAVNKGHGTEAMRLLLRHAFYTLGLNKVKIEVIAYNLGLLKLCNNMGFKMDVKHRQHHFYRNIYYSVFELSMLRSEFNILLPSGQEYTGKVPQGTFTLNSIMVGVY